MTILCISHQGLSQQKNHKINGIITNVKVGNVSLLKYSEASSSDSIIKKAKVKDGKFLINGSLEASEMMSLNIQPGNWTIPIFIEAGDISITADTSTKQYKIVGSENNDAWLQFINDSTYKSFKAKIAEIGKKLRTVSDKDEEEKIMEEYYSNDASFKKWQLNYILEYINNNPSSAAGVYMLYPLRKLGAVSNILFQSLNQLKGDAKNTVYFKNLQRLYNEIKFTLPGVKAPAIVGTKPDGSLFSLKDVKSKYILLDFWATWCLPCVKAIPHWKEVYKKYHDNGLEIVGISADRNREAWLKGLSKQQMPWIQVVDSFPSKTQLSTTQLNYMAIEIPRYFLLDKNGVIIINTTDDKEIDAKLKELLEQ